MTLKNEKKLQFTILIVDHNPKNLEVLGKLLQLEKYKIEFALNGKTALEWLAVNQFDIILLDINMPGMNGFEVCEKIRSNQQWDNIPVIFLSADNERESILKGFEMGAQDFVTKPFDSRELIMRVKTHLALKNSREELEKLNLLLEQKVFDRTRKLNEALVRAESSDLLKTAFMNNISHELRTPLNGILGFAQFIILPDISDEMKQYYLNILNTNSERLLNTITNYMDASLIISGNQKINKKSFSPDLIINEIIEKFKQPCADKGLTLTLDIPLNRNFQIISDAELISKIVYHLIDNAIKFTKNGGISVGYKVKQKQLEFFVTDTGMGIDEEARKLVFSFFTQGDTSNTRGFEGSGLGLSIAHGLVKLLNGKIECESKKGIGSTFYFAIPFGEPEYTM